MGYYQQKMRVVLTRRAGDWLRLQEWPRLYAAVILLICGFTAVVCWLRLTEAGWNVEWQRVGMSCLGAYVIYLGCLAVWFLRFAPMTSQELLAGGFEDEIVTPVPGESEFDDSLETQIDTAAREAAHDVRSVLGLFVAAAVLGAVFVSAYFIYHAPYFMGQLLVDGGKIRHRSVSRGTPLDPIVLPFLQSWPVAVALIMHYTLIGLAWDAGLRFK